MFLSRDNVNRRIITTDDTLLERAKSLPNPFRRESALGFPLRRTISVGMGFYAITDAKSSIKQLMTYGMLPCIAVGLIDDKTNTIGMAHFTVQNSPRSLLTILDEMFPTLKGQEKEEALRRVRIVLRGGSFDSYLSRNLAIGLLRVIDENNLNLVGAMLNHEDGKLLNGFLINAKSKKITSRVVSLKGMRSVEFTPTMLSKPLEKVYDGRRNTKN